MSLHPTDFGNGLVSIMENDAFFLDTNILVSVLHEKNKYHLACYTFITYLIKNEIPMCVSETVIAETVHSLARVCYIQDRFDELTLTNGEPVNKKAARALENTLRREWINKVIKNDPLRLRDYNARAIELIRPLLGILFVIPCNDEIIEATLDIAIDTPLASADAFIIAAAIHPDSGCRGVVTTDRDLHIVFQTEIFSSSVANEDFNAVELLSELDMIGYLLDSLGPDEFYSKYPAMKDIIHVIGE